MSDLASRLRAIAYQCNETMARELNSIALIVERQEHALDEIAAEAFDVAQVSVPRGRLSVIQGGRA